MSETEAKALCNTWLLRSLYFSPDSCSSISRAFALQGRVGPLTLADQQRAASLHGHLLLPALLVAPHFLLQLSLQLL